MEQPAAICLLLITIIASSAFDGCCFLPSKTILVSFQVLKGGHEAPTKPKGRPKKNSIPTTEEIEAEELRLRMEEEERMRRMEEKAALAQGGEAAQREPQDLSTETLNPSAAMERSEQELPVLMQSDTHTAS